MPVVGEDLLPRPIQRREIERDVRTRCAAAFADNDRGQRWKVLLDSVEGNVSQDLVEDTSSLPLEHLNRQAFVVRVCLQDDCELPKDNGKAIGKVCRQFVVLCQQLDLFSDAVVPIDGSKFKAVNSSDWNFTDAKLKRRMAEIEANISRYLEEIDTADRQEPGTVQSKSVRLNDKIAAMKSQMATLKEIEARLIETGETQISLTNADSRSMMTRSSGIIGYNVQTAVDAKHHFIVEHEVTNNGSDRDQLSGMAKKARAAIGTTTLTAIADRGYFKGEEILACREAGISVLVPPTKTSGAKADGRFDKADFIYDPLKNEYRCPADEFLIWRFASVEKGMTLDRYWSSNCKGCHLKEKCTPSTQRRVSAGSTSMCSTKCRCALRKTRMPCEFGVARSSIRTGRSNLGWGRHTS